MDEAVETVVTRFRSVKGPGDAYGDVENATREKIDNMSDDERQALLLALRTVRIGPDVTGLSRSEVVCLLGIFRYVESMTDPEPAGRLLLAVQRDAARAYQGYRAADDDAPAYPTVRAPSAGSSWLVPVIVWAVAVLGFLTLLGVIEQGL